MSLTSKKFYLMVQPVYNLYDLNDDLAAKRTTTYLQTNGFQPKCARTSSILLNTNNILTMNITTKFHKKVTEIIGDIFARKIFLSLKKNFQNVNMLEYLLYNKLNSNQLSLVWYITVKRLDSSP